MTARLPFTELALRRAIAAARKAGLRVSGTTIAPDGTITVHYGEPGIAPIVSPAQHAMSSEYEDFQA